MPTFKKTWFSIQFFQCFFMVESAKIPSCLAPNPIVSNYANNGVRLYWWKLSSSPPTSYSISAKFETRKHPLKCGTKQNKNQSLKNYRLKMLIFPWAGFESRASRGYRGQTEFWTDQNIFYIALVRFFCKANYMI